jgi:hypothetical protein
MKMVKTIILPVLAAAFLSGAETVSAQDVAPTRSARAKVSTPQGQEAPKAGKRRAFSANKAQLKAAHKAKSAKQNTKRRLFEKQMVVNTLKAKMRAAKASGKSALEIQKLEHATRNAKSKMKALASRQIKVRQQANGKDAQRSKAKAAGKTRPKNAARAQKPRAKKSRPRSGGRR